MQSFACNSLRRRLAVECLTCLQPARRISLTGAIGKGVRDAQHSASRHEARYTNPRPGNLAQPIPKERNAAVEQGGRQNVRSRTSNRNTPQERDEKPARTPAAIPTALPYTTASSEFIYGTFSVLSALKARRRKLYRLYRLRSQTQARDSDKSAAAKTKADRLAEWDHNQAQEDIYKLARAAGVEVKDVWGPEWNRILSKASTGRPHNGVVLEASPLPKLPVTSLSSVSKPSDDILANVGWASQEDREVNSVFETRGNVAVIPSVRPSHRYPFMLLLDCITDTGNFGAIVRSAWFLGVDAILILEHGTAPISTNSLKASAGALEYMPILHVKNERSFVKASRENGWKFFAADAPEKQDTFPNRRRRGEKAQMLPFQGALLSHPCVLVLGNEGAGVRDFLKSLVDGIVGIPNARPHVGDIDSLNVSVAAALMTQKFFDSAPAPSGTE
ncbi:hypothetical protein KCU88_g3734, partial [Aureobasidium melanogenum]